MEAIGDILAARNTAEKPVNSGEPTVTTETQAVTAEPASSTVETPSKTVEEPRTPRDPLTGKFAPKNPAPVTAAPAQTPPPAQPTDPDSDPKNWTYAAFKDEKSKRQQIQGEAQQLRARNAELERQFAEHQRQQAQPPIDFFTDPDAAIKQRFSPVEDRMHQIERNAIFRASRAEAIAQHGKDVVGATVAALREAHQAGDPEIQRLAAEMDRSDDPVGLAIDWHKRSSVLKEVGEDPAAYRERIKAEVLAELQGQGGTTPPKPAAQQVQPSAMPSNFGAARNVGVRAGPAWSGPPSLNDIFKR